MLATGDWEQLPNIPTPRAACGLAEMDGKIYVAGGRNSDKSLATVEIFDPEVGKWLDGQLMRSQRAYHTSVTCGGCIFSVGGMLTRELLSSVERLDPRVVSRHYFSTSCPDILSRTLTLICAFFDASLCVSMKRKECRWFQFMLH